jgi:hypothetical protein
MSSVHDIPRQFVNPQAPYQPRLTEQEYGLLIRRRFEELERSVIDTLGEGETARAGRLCVDRFVMIQAALSDEIPHLSFTDLGCANGMFCIALKALGARRVVGVDNDEHAHTLDLNIPHCLEQAKEDAARFKLEVEFYNLNLKELIQSHQPFLESDVVLALSVFHHLFFGYGYLPSSSPVIHLGDRAETFFKWIDIHCKRHLIFETHEGVFADWKSDEIENKLTASKLFKSVKLLGISMGFDSKARSLWLCSR